MKRLIAAALLAGLAGTTFAKDITIGNDESCPSGTFELSRAYSLEGLLDGRLVRTGTVCRDLTTSN
jgi:hypothetical protein